MAGTMIRASEIGRFIKSIIAAEPAECKKRAFILVARRSGQIAEHDSLEINNTNSED
jgi:hypothetical protein